MLLHPSHTEGRNAEYNIKYLRPCLGCCSVNNCCCLAQFLPRSWQLREERETCSLQAGAVMLHMFACKGGLSDFFILQSAASPNGNLQPCLRMVWHTMGPSLSAPVRRKAQSTQSQQAERTEGSSSARTPHSPETKLEMIIQTVKENNPFTSLGRDLPTIREGSFPKKPKVP